MRCAPILLTSRTDAGRTLPRLEAKPHGDITETWLQQLLYQHPELLPVDEFDESLGPTIPLGREVPTDTGPIDLFYTSPSGGLILVETKLWKNPEKHRDVVAQLIDYAKELTTWTYDDLCDAIQRASRRQGENDVGLESKVTPYLEQLGVGVTEFQEDILANLRNGRYLLLVVGDRIARNIALMTNAIQSAPGLNFTFGLVEMKIYRQADTADWPLIVVPDIVGRTVETVRGVIEIRYKHEQPEVAVEIAGSQNQAKSPLDQRLFLDSVPAEIKPIYTAAIEKWKALGGTFRSSADNLFWEMSSMGTPRTVIRANRRKLYLIRRWKFDEWGSKSTLYDEYVKRLAASPLAHTAIHDGPIVLRYSDATPKDVQVALDAAMWLAETIRDPQQYDQPV
jgi:hypothetical protein